MSLPRALALTLAFLPMRPPPCGDLLPLRTDGRCSVLLIQIFTTILSVRQSLPAPAPTRRCYSLCYNVENFDLPVSLHLEGAFTKPGLRGGVVASFTLERHPISMFSCFDTPLGNVFQSRQGRGNGDGGYLASLMWPWSVCTFSGGTTYSVERCLTPSNSFEK